MAWSPFVVYTAALMCAIALLSSYAQADCGGFAVSCSDISVTSDGGLYCTCGDGQGGYQHSSIDLNAHISNNDGNLVDGGGFASTCKNTRWYELGTDNQGIAAECYKTDGSLGSTTLYNVERRVANDGGTLVFNNCRRRSLLESMTKGSEIFDELMSSRKLLKE